MKLFLSQKSDIQSVNPQEKLSKLIEVFANYVRAPQRNLVNINMVSKADQDALKISQVPMLIKSSGAEGEEPVSCSNTITIMLEISRAAYLEEVLFGSSKGKERPEILSFIELAQGMSGEELAKFVNNHLIMKMFLVGTNVTAADIITCLYVAPYFKELMDFQKIELCHAFRWIDHIQHLPGLDELINSLGLFVSFPDTSQGEPSASQLKKLKKIEAAKKKKEDKAAGVTTAGADANAEGGKQKQQQKPKKEEEKKQSEVEGEKKQIDSSAAAEKPAEQKPKQQKQQKGEKQKQNPPKKGAAGADLHELSKVDIRVGKIVWVEKNPNSEKLYNEKVDIGNGEIRTIASGLQKDIPIEGMQDQLCIVIVNLRARPLAGWNSHGMVLCGETEDRSIVELLQPPAGSKAGDTISFEGYPREPLENPPKKNPWEKVGPCLLVNEKSQACYKDKDGNLIPFSVNNGVVTSATVKNGIVK